MDRVSGLVTTEKLVVVTAVEKCWERWSPIARELLS